MALGVLVDYHALLGDAELAGRYADRAAAIGRRVTAPEMRAMTWAMQGRVHQAREELTEAIASYQSALSALPGFTPAWARYQAEYLAEIARSYQELGDVSLARESWTAALDLLRRAGHPLAAQVRSELGTLPGSSADRP
jgi:tetratricopeptide (TPR) repeat protein